jgi:hypothetical protein
MKLGCGHYLSEFISGHVNVFYLKLPVVELIAVFKKELIG